MAAQKKTAEVDYSMQEKILALYELQKIDSKIDEINKIKGELPLEVQDLEDELAGLNTRIEHINGEIEELNALTKQRKREVDQAKILIGNYKEQQNNVRNNREFDAITKEIEYQELEIELAEKRLKEYAAAVKAKKALLEETEGIVADRKADLEVKQGELKSIEEETASQVAEFGEQADVAKAKIDERLLAAYNRIRSNVHNGLAVVTVKRDACGGCFNRIPPQRQADIRQGKKDHHLRILRPYSGRRSRRRGRVVPVTGHSGGFVSFGAEPLSLQCPAGRASDVVAAGREHAFFPPIAGREAAVALGRTGDCAEVCTGRYRRAVGAPCRGCRSFVAERDAARHILGENVPISPNNRYLCIIYIGKLKFLIDENRSCSVELYDRRH